MITLNTIDTLVEQAIQANVEAYRTAEKDYYYWIEALADPECDPVKRTDYIAFKESSFAEFMAIKGTLDRLFPNHKEEIFDGLTE